MPIVKGRRTIGGVDPLPNAASTALSAPTPRGPELSTRLSEVGSEIYERETKKQDDLAFMGAVRSIGDTENKLLYDPKDGAYAARGKDVLGVHESAMGGLDGSVQEVMKGLNPRQRLRFEQYWASRRDGVSRGLLQHTSTQMDAFAAEETDAFVAVETKSAAFNYANPEKVNSAMTNIRSAIATFGVNYGKSAQWIENTTFSAVSQLHRQVVDHMIANNDTTNANEYVFGRNGNREAMTHKDVVEVSKFLKTANVKGAGQSLADDAFENQPNREAAGKYIIEMTDGIPDGPSIRAAAMSVLDNHYARRNAAQNERDEELSRSLMSRIQDANGNLSVVEYTPEWASLSPGVQSSLMRMAGQWAEYKSVKTNAEEWANFEMLAATPEGQRVIMGRNLAVYSHVFSTEKMAQARTMKAAMLKGLSDEQQARLRDKDRQNQAVTLAIEELGYTKKDDQKDIARFRQAYNRGVEEWERGNPNQDITNEASKEILAEIKTQVAKDPSLLRKLFSSIGVMDDEPPGVMASALPIDEAYDLIPQDRIKVYDVMLSQFYGRAATRAELVSYHAKVELQMQRDKEAEENKNRTVESFEGAGLRMPEPDVATADAPYSDPVVRGVMGAVNKKDTGAASMVDQFNVEEGKRKPAPEPTEDEAVKDLYKHTSPSGSDAPVITPLKEQTKPEPIPLAEVDKTIPIIVDRSVAGMDRHQRKKFFEERGLPDVATLEQQRKKYYDEYWDKPGRMLDLRAPYEARLRQWEVFNRTLTRAIQAMTLELLNIVPDSDEYEEKKAILEQRKELHLRLAERRPEK